MNKAILILMIIMILPLSSASIENLGTFKQGSCVNLLQTCADCTYNNISSVTQPDGVKGLSVLTTMTKTGTEYIYEFCNTTKSGVYNVNGYGDAASTLTKWNYMFDITPVGGAENNTTFFLILIGIAIVLLLFGFIFHNYIFAFFGGISFLIVGIYSMIYGYGDVTNTYSRMIALVLIGLGALITILSGLDLLGSFDNRNYSDDY